MNKYALAFFDHETLTTATYAWIPEQACTLVHVSAYVPTVLDPEDETARITIAGSVTGTVLDAADAGRDGSPREWELEDFDTYAHGNRAYPHFQKGEIISLTITAPTPPTWVTDLTVVLTFQDE